MDTNEYVVEVKIKPINWKKCRNAYMREYRKKNKDRINEQRRQRYQEQIEKMRSYNRDYYKNKRDKVKLRAWHKAHPRFSTKEEYKAHFDKYKKPKEDKALD